MIIFGNINTLDNQVESSIKADGIEVFYAESFSHLESIYHSYENVKAILVDGDTEMPAEEQNFKYKFNMKKDKTLFIFIAEYRLSAVARALQAGFDEFMAKPVSKDALYALLNQKNK